MVYFIPTPIGNLEDVTLRSLKLLSECHTLFCEDTRITKKLLNLLSQRHEIEFNIQNFISMHSHNENEVLASLDKEIFQKNIAYLSDAGMPCISDPGAAFIRYCQNNELEYEILPGANAALLAYATSGFKSSRFSFFGFLPHKGKDRANALSEAINSKYPVIIYESPHRIEKLANELATLIPERKACFIKEATKKFEKKLIFTCKKINEKLQSMNLKGEWAIVIDSCENEAGEIITKEDILALKLPPKQKAKLLAKVTGESVNFWYEKLLNEDT